ncbi:MAG: class II fumarate hydratase [Candidatus Limnocylindrus sp.]
MGSDKAGGTRSERDSFGPIDVPADRHWGAQTARSLKFFAIGEEVMPQRLIHALALIKRAAATVNAELGLLPAEIAAQITSASDEVASGALRDEFPLSIWQTGSGTQTNMNVNEVIASRANELATGARGGKSPVHPNDHVNLSQSSNDVFPTAIHVAAVLAVNEQLIPALTQLHGSLMSKAKSWSSIVKIGRTHLQDAVPLTLGQEFGAHATALAGDIKRIESARNDLYPLALGGTAVGTGLNSHPEFAERAAKQIASLTTQPFTSAPDKFTALAGQEPTLHLSAALRTVAATLMKLANDVRWLSSGPRAGLGELNIPENEPGSSIMPGKVNPTQAEALTMVAVQVYGLDAAIAFAASQGNFQLNVYKPLIAHNLLSQVRLLADASRSFALHCIDGMEPNEKRINELLDASLMLVTALTPAIGYDKAAEIAKQAHATGGTLRETALKLGYVSASEYDALVQPTKMTKPQR